MHLKIGQKIVVGYGAMSLCALSMTGLTIAGMPENPSLNSIALVGVGLTATLLGMLLVWHTVRQISQPLDATIAMARRIASGDLGDPIVASASGELGQIQDALQQASERIFSIVARVRTGTAAVATSAGIITNDNAALSSRTEQQASSLEQTAASMEELTNTVKHNAENAQQANHLMSSTTDVAIKGGAVVEEVISTMESIKDSSRKVVDIIGVIDGIAFQTNILALNAAVEAARAGEQGRGFAVVASEVRVLAQRSASAAKEIKELINTSVSEVELGGQKVDEAGRAMREIVSGVKYVASIMHDISEASRDQSNGLAEISLAVKHIDENTQKNSSLVDAATLVASNLRDQAVDLTAAVSGFQLGRREFGTESEAVEMVDKAVNFAKQHGVNQLISDVCLQNRSQFVDRDLYLSLYDTNYICRGNGANPRYVGIDGNVFKDNQGKYFVKEIVNKACTEGSGWVAYNHPHPISKEYQPKRAYFERVGDLVISCGVY